MTVDYRYVLFGKIFRSSAHCLSGMFGFFLILSFMGYLYILDSNSYIVLSLERSTFNCCSDREVNDNSEI